MIDVTYKHIDSSPALTAFTEEKFAKIQKLLGPEARIKVTFWQYDKKKVADANVYAGKHHFFAKSHSDDFHKTLENLKSKIKVQVLKYKNR